MDFFERIQTARDSVLAKNDGRPDIGLVLGTGRGKLPDGLAVLATIPYRDIAGFPVSSAPGHAGNLVLGRLHNRAVAILQGRLHLYEGFSAKEVALPVYLLGALGIRTLLITNAAGALNAGYRPGEVMLIEDHINFTGHNPLVGDNDERLGLRFPDMSDAYASELRNLATTVAAEIPIAIQSGTYAGVLGPSLETSAERRYLRLCGADAVGMSTVMEVIAANHAGIRVLALSAITNVATGEVDQQPDTIEQVMEQAAIAGEKINQLLAGIIERLGNP